MRSDITQLPAVKTAMERLDPPLKTPWEYLAVYGRLADALVYGRLFWPEFIEVEGGVFLADKVARGGSQPLAAKWGDIQLAQLKENLTSVWDLFLNEHADTEPPREYYEALAEVLRDSWAAAAHARFPDRTFHFEPLQDGQAYGPSVTFWAESVHQQSGGSPK